MAFLFVSISLLTGTKLGVSVWYGGAHEQSSRSMDELSQAFKALGHPHRLALIRRLIEEAMSCTPPSDGECTLDPACCDFGELADEIGVGKPTVSHHLKVLRQAGLVERIQEGRRVYCSVNEDRLAELRAFLSLDATPEMMEV